MNRMGRVMHHSRFGQTPGSPNTSSLGEVAVDVWHHQSSEGEETANRSRLAGQGGSSSSGGGSSLDWGGLRHGSSEGSVDMSSLDLEGGEQQGGVASPRGEGIEKPPHRLRFSHVLQSDLSSSVAPSGPAAAADGDGAGAEDERLGGLRLEKSRSNERRRVGEDAFVTAAIQRSGSRDVAAELERAQSWVWDAVPMSGEGGQAVAGAVAGGEAVAKDEAEEWEEVGEGEILAAPVELKNILKKQAKVVRAVVQVSQQKLVWVTQWIRHWCSSCIHTYIHVYVRLGLVHIMKCFGSWLE